MGAVATVLGLGAVAPPSSTNQEITMAVEAALLAAMATRPSSCLRAARPRQPTVLVLAATVQRTDKFPPAEMS